MVIDNHKESHLFNMLQDEASKAMVKDLIKEFVENHMDITNDNLDAQLHNFMNKKTGEL